MRIDAKVPTNLASALYGSAADMVNMRYCRMSDPKIKIRQVLSRTPCGGKTNTGDDCIILVSSAVNPKYDKGKDGWDAHHHFVKREAVLLADYLARKGNLDGHSVDKVEVVHPAKSSDLYAALEDTNVASIAIIGHSNRGGWLASDANIDWADIRCHIPEWKTYCKTGFGLTTGCDVARDRHELTYFLSDFYGHSHIKSGLYVTQGRRYTNIDAYAGADSTTNRGLSVRPTLIRVEQDSSRHLLAAHGYARR